MAVKTLPFTDDLRPFRGRDIDSATKFFVYRNVHEECWSGRAVDGRFAGRVVFHADSCALINAEFVVSEAGRQRVLREGRKNVHAGVVGELVTDHSRWFTRGGYLDFVVRYNPYEMGSFMMEDPHGWPDPRWLTPIVRADRVHLGIGGVVLAGGAH